MQGPFVDSERTIDFLFNNSAGLFLLRKVVFWCRLYKKRLFSLDKKKTNLLIKLKIALSSLSLVRGVNETTQGATP